MNRSQPLDIWTFPLHGIQLIEASAGTGKTYTLAALYVRLVLGDHGSDDHPVLPLYPPDILVLTFTNAATLELRERVRARLVQCARVLRDTGYPGDPFTEELSSRYQEPIERNRAALRLERAAQWMDEAAIYTIHGWAQRMLVRYPFETGTDASEVLETDTHSLLQQVAEDYWRIFCTPVSQTVFKRISETLGSPARLVAWARPLVVEPLETVIDGEAGEFECSPLELSGSLERWTATRTESLEQLRLIWIGKKEEIRAALEQAQERNDLNRTKTSRLNEHLVSVENWLEFEVEPDNLDQSLTYLLIDQTKVKKGKTAPDYAVKAALEAYRDLLADKPSLAPVIRHALSWLVDQFDRAKQQRGVTDYNDLLKRVDQALARDQGGLHQRLRTQYPVALIDEFQDTDPTQYRIFRSIYFGHPERALILIGDPKQAIYGFRGADIQTYLKASKDAHQRFNLTTNFRSKPRLISSTNALFEYAEQLNAQGAFGMGDSIGFTPVEAPQDSTKVQSLDPESGLHLLALEPHADQEPSPSAEQIKRAQANLSVQRIVELVERQTRLDTQPSSKQPFKASDIAVLVRSGKDAALIQDTLADSGLPSVYLSDRESVFATQEALDIWRWLVALNAPRDYQKLISALASPSLGLAFEHLTQLKKDDALWVEQVEQFEICAQIWRTQGILAAIRALMTRYLVAQNLLGTFHGERQLTNLLHLAELLQQESLDHESGQGLIRYLTQQIQNPQNQSDAPILRMESDAQRIQIITLHKSKGLEYPYVFIPFGMSMSASKGSSQSGLVLETDGLRQAYIGSLPSDLKKQASQAQLAEEIRLFYVGLTRAIHSCYLGITHVRGTQNTAFGRLIGIDKTVDSEKFYAQVQRLIEVCPDIQYEQHSPIEPKPVETSINRVEKTGARKLDHPIVDDAWWISSYSALVHRLSSAEEQSSTRTEMLDEEMEQRVEHYLELGSEAAPDRSVQAPSIHRFIRGAQAGTYLHEVLERAALAGFGEVSNSPKLIDELLQTPPVEADNSASRDLLRDWIERIICRPLPVDERSLSLAQVKSYRSEMEFIFCVDHASVAELDQICCQAILPGQPRPNLMAKQLNGALKGFIDLVFEDQNQFFVLDYKSNWLGPTDDYYGEERMTESLLQKRYDVQLMLYLIALHRTLIARDQTYAADPQRGYAERVGGALYLFLRGIDHPKTAGTLLLKPEYSAISALDQLMRLSDLGPES